MTDWYVGQKVVCVDVSGVRPWRLAVGRLVRGSVYTIREIFFEEGECGLRLVEVIGKLSADGVEITPRARRFRPVVIPEADLAQFEVLLRGVEQRELVEA